MGKHNLYPGINPHLNSALQQRGGGWRSFHAAYLIYLFDLLDRTLPENYYAVPEEALQIGTYDSEMMENSPTVADILISKRDRSSQAVALTLQTHTPTLTLPVPRLLAEEDELTAVVIRKESGEAVTRIELLSPANKPGGSHFGQYIEKRNEALLSHLRMIELDFIYTRRPLLSDIPDYTMSQTGSFPYHILVTDPRPDIQHGKTDVHSFGVMDTIPVIAVPLDNADYIAVDFGDMYQTIISRRAFSNMIDYTKAPVSFNAYSPEDQALILAHMAKIAEEQA